MVPGPRPRPVHSPPRSGGYSDGVGVRSMSGVVLAGGASRRMGRDKALMELDGEPLVARAVRLLSGVCSDVAVASGDGRRLDGAGLGVRQVADVVPDAGPVAGIAAGLEAGLRPAR